MLDAQNAPFITHFRLPLNLRAVWPYGFLKDFEMLALSNPLGYIDTCIN